MYLGGVFTESTPETIGKFTLGYSAMNKTWGAVALSCTFMNCLFAGILFENKWENIDPPHPSKPPPLQGYLLIAW